MEHVFLGMLHYARKGSSELQCSGVIYYVVSIYRVKYNTVLVAGQKIRRPNFD